MQPDFTTLKLADQQPDFGSLKLASTPQAPQPSPLDGWGMLDTQTGKLNSSYLQPFGGMSDIGNQASGGLQQIKEGLAQGSPTAPNASLGNLFSGTGKILSGASSILTSPLAPLLKPVSTAMNTVSNAISDIPAVQKFAQTPTGQTTTRVAGDIANYSNAAGTIGGVAASGFSPSKTIQTVKNTVNKAGTAIKNEVFAPAPTAEPVDTGIIASYNKAIKPSTAGKTGPGQLDMYNNNVATAIKAITDNKANITLEDSVQGAKLPQSRGELSDALSQTKASIFDQYNALATKATGQGVQIPLENAGDALGSVIDSKSLEISNPEAVNYAKTIHSRLLNPDGTYRAIDPATAQEVIKNYNGSLSAFYKNPTYETASRAAIDAGVVHEIRTALDEAINNATGENYQALKNQYGALSSIEKDVNKAAIAQAKLTGTNMAGLGKYIDIFSGGDMVHGLATLNPALFTKGAAQAGLSHYFQWLNNPDRAVGTMFKNVENYSNQPLRAPSTIKPTNTNIIKGNIVKSVTETAPKVNPIPKDNGLASLSAEATKYKTAEEFVKSIRGSATQYGDYNPSLRTYGMSDYKPVSELGVKPDKMVTIYRGIDKTIGKVTKQINDGDFVTTDFESALSYTGDAKDVVSMKVPAKTLYTDAIRDFKDEPFYTGSEYIYTKQKVSPKTPEQLTEIWKSAKKN